MHKNTADRELDFSEINILNLLRIGQNPKDSLMDLIFYFQTRELVDAYQKLHALQSKQHASYVDDFLITTQSNSTSQKINAFLADKQSITPPSQQNFVPVTENINKLPRTLQYYIKADKDRFQRTGTVLLSCVDYMRSMAETLPKINGILLHINSLEDAADTHNKDLIFECLQSSVDDPSQYHDGSQFDEIEARATYLYDLFLGENSQKFAPLLSLFILHDHKAPSSEDIQETLTNNQNAIKAFFENLHLFLALTRKDSLDLKVVYPQAFDRAFQHSQLLYPNQAPNIDINARSRSTNISSSSTFDNTGNTSQQYSALRQAPHSHNDLEQHPHSQSDLEQPPSQNPLDDTVVNNDTSQEESPESEKLVHAVDTIHSHENSQTTGFLSKIMSALYFVFQIITWPFRTIYTIYIQPITVKTDQPKTKGLDLSIRRNKTGTFLQPSKSSVSSRSFKQSKFRGGGPSVATSQKERLRKSR
tara:strand:+ start:2087 stop:3514 length:1428 start_codon:yes stop_codon:yes gene_type:complete